MIKKLIVALAVLIALVIAGVLLFRQVAGPSDAATLLPEDTILYATFADLPRSAIRWQGTALAAISREPEVKALLEKPLASMQANPGAGEAGGILGGLKPTRIFVALTEITADRADAIVGFQFWGGQKDFDVAVARLRRELPASAEQREVYEGDEIVSTVHGKFTLSSAAHGRWGFLSTSPELLRAVLGRVKGNVSGPTLAESEDYRSAMDRMLSAPDFAFFLRPEKPMNTLLEVGRSLGADAISQQVSQIRRTAAVAATWKFDGALQRDAIFFLRPDPAPVGAIEHKAVRFTRSDTVLYVDFLARLAGLQQMLMRALPERQEAAAELAALSEKAFGPEAGLILNWPSGQMTPTPVFALEIRDPALATASLEKFLSFFPEATITDRDGLKLYNIPAVSNPLAAPTLALADGFLLVGLDAGAVSAAAAGGGGDLPALPAFASAASAYQESNEAFAFVDTRAVFEHAYAALRPVLLFWAQVSPGAVGGIDTSKLPQSDTVARHLAPIILSQRRLEQGVLIESSGPFTVSQLAIGVAAGTAWGTAGR